MGVLPVNVVTNPEWRPGVVIFLLLIHVGIALDTRKAQRSRAEQKRVADIAKEVAEQERHLRKAQAVFFSFVAHELRTPLGVLLIGLKNIGRSFDPAEETTQLRVNRLSRTVETMGRLVERHLSFQRLNTADFSPVFETVPTLGPAEDALAESRDANPLREFKMTVADGVPSAITMDRSLIKMALNNLLGNAAKFATADTPIDLKIFFDGAINYRVVDQGPGMPPDGLDRLFIVYQRERRTDEQAGFGIGLAICKRIAELHLGTLIYAPGPVSGATFTLSFPSNA
jgi:signal transduction histidine kinase